MSQSVATDATLRHTMIALIVVAVAASYLGSLNGPFVFDDVPAILTNPTLRHPGEVGRLLVPPGDEAGTVAGRPLLNLTLALNFALGGTRVWGYHLLNVLIHLSGALVLFGIVRRTVEKSPVIINPAVFAGAAALIWALHPLQTQAVTYVIQRAEALMGLCYLATLYCFIRGWKALALAFCFAGMATKEPMVSAPIMVFLYDRTFVAGSFAGAWRQNRSFYLGLASSWLLLATLVVTTHGRGGSAGFASSASEWNYVLTQCGAIVTYLRLSFWPNPLIFDYGPGLVQNLADVFWQAALVAALLTASVWALVRYPVVGFLCVWFFAILAPSSSFVPIATEPIAEQRMYLSLAAIVLLLLLAADKLIARTTQKANRTATPRSFAFGVAFVVIALGCATIRRNLDYGSAVALWRDTAAKLPSSPRARNDLGTALKDLGDLAGASAEFSAAIDLQPTYAPAQFNLGVLLLDSNRAVDAIPHLERALLAPLHHAELVLYLAQAMNATRRYREAAQYGAEAMRLSPRDPQAAFAEGNALAGLGLFRQAAGAFEKAVALAPQTVSYRVNLGNSLLLSGQPGPAAAQYREALRIHPGDASIETNLDVALRQGGR